MKKDIPNPRRRELLVSGIALGILFGSHSSFARMNHMKRETCTIQVKVLNHWLIQRFQGDAILASPKPRFVVALLIMGTKMPYQVQDTPVTFTTHRVAFFAVSSIVKVFAETDVVGKEYQLVVEQREIDGRLSYGIGRDLS